MREAAKKPLPKRTVRTAGPRAVAVDPGKHKLAIASLDIYGKGVPEVAVIEGWDWKLLRGVLKKMFVPGSHLVVEGQYVGLNPASALDLACVRGFVEGAACGLGYKVHPALAPSTWQAAYKIGGRREQRKEQARITAGGLLAALGLKWKGQVQDSDLADAICMAGWLKDKVKHGQG